jgi:Outer membrane protein beta-barrel domain
VRVVHIVLAIVVVSLVGGPLQAQEDLFPPRSGLWGGFGIGAGYGEGAGEYQGGGSFNAQLGGTLNPKLAIGADLSMWAWRSNRLTVSANTLSGAVTFFPSPTGGLFLKGGVGFAATVNEVNLGGGKDTQTDSGLGIVLGVGQDVRLGMTLFLTPAFTFMFQRIGEENLEFFLFTVGLTWR